MPEPSLPPDPTPASDADVLEAEVVTPASALDPAALSAAADQERAKLEARARSGAHWFYWVAALSLVNSALALTGSQWGFIVGLGATQCVDAILKGVAQQIGSAATVIAAVLDLLIVAVLVLFGYLATRRHTWAFIVGMVCYGLDGLIFLLVQDWLSLGFHAFVLYGLWAGVRANMRLARRPASVAANRP